MQSNRAGQPSRRSKKSTWFFSGWIFLVVVAGQLPTSAKQPRVLLKNAKLDCIATEPEIVTPISVAFDHKGRLLVIESHTHQRPEDYNGPEGDRIRMLSDTNGDGEFDRWSTFAEGFQQAMNICVANPGEVYLVTRREVLLLKDNDGDGVADQRENVLYLTTKVEYPHNGLSGICLHKNKRGETKLLVGLGENFGEAYSLLGADGREVRGRGGAGTVFECTPAGKQLRRFATGFWNPFAITSSHAGDLFTVDNDPDASPPCRLIHVVESGDFGYRYEYSRAGNHPLQAWDGEFPGTLPMICGTGEAPCAVVSHQGYLWVTSWGDYRLERYRLKPRGASFSAEREIVVQGDADFRPTGLAVAPDGSLYFSDWVDRSYPVHQKGRLWRLQLPPESRGSASKLLVSENGVKQEPSALEEFVALATDEDPFRRQQAVANWSQAQQSWRDALAQANARGRLVRLQGLHWNGEQDQDVEQVLADALEDPASEVRLFALRWIAEWRFVQFREHVSRLLEESISEERYFLSVLATLDWLSEGTKHRRSTHSEDVLVREILSKERGPQLKTLALGSISPNHTFLTPERLRVYAKNSHEPLRLEAIRSIAQRGGNELVDFLAAMARDNSESDRVRQEAVAGLAAYRDKRELLRAIAESGNGPLANEAKRFLRLSSGASEASAQAPDASDLSAWAELMEGQGDPVAGERLFFAQVGPSCAKCHRYRGRGGEIGPDLTRISDRSAPDRILASILQPSQEISPSYQSWILLTDDGKSHVGLRLHKSGDDGIEEYANADGETFVIESDSIEIREASDISIMPNGLDKLMTVEDLQDLLAFLVGR